MTSYGLVGYVEVIVLDVCNRLILSLVSSVTPEDNNNEKTIKLIINYDPKKYVSITKV